MSPRAPGALTGLGTRGLAAGLLLALGACASSGGKERPTNPFTQDLAERSQIRIRVENFNFNDATVWVLVRNERRQRLGTVTGKSSSVFTIPWTFSEPMRLEFDLLADVRCVTEEMSVDPGDILELQISVDPSSDPQCRR